MKKYILTIVALMPCFSAVATEQPNSSVLHLATAQGMPQSAQATVYDPWAFCPPAEKYADISLRAMAQSSQAVLLGKVLKVSDKQTNNPKEVVSNRCWADVQVTHWYKQPAQFSGSQIRIVSYFIKKPGAVNDIKNCPITKGTSYLFLGNQAKGIEPKTQAIHVNPICGGALPEEFAGSAINALNHLYK